MLGKGQASSQMRLLCPTSPLRVRPTKVGSSSAVMFNRLIFVLWLSSGSSSGLPEWNASAMAMLEGMGFPPVRCHRALLATGNSDGEAAMEWLFAHMDDAGQSWSWSTF